MVPLSVNKASAAFFPFMFIFYPLCTIIIWLCIRDFDITFVCIYSGGNLFRQSYFSTFCYVVTLWLKKKKKKKIDLVQVMFLERGWGGHSKTFTVSAFSRQCAEGHLFVSAVPDCAGSGTFPRCSLKNTCKLAKTEAHVVFYCLHVYPALQLNLRHLNACLTN